MKMRILGNSSSQELNDNKMNCDFCDVETDGKIILRDVMLEKKDGSDIILCGDCLNLYANHEYEKLNKKIKK